jgi:CHAD domain-containing protein
MRIERKKAEEILDKLQELLDKDPKKLDGDEIHRLRALTRKTETLIDALRPGLRKNELSANGRRSLKRLRRRAGKVRDADVQIALLRPVSLHGATDQKEYLIQALNKDRAEGIEKLDKFLGSKATKISKRLEKIRGVVSGGSSVRTRQNSGEPVLQEAFRHYRELAANPALSPEDVHNFRKRCKHIRYFTELGKETAASRRFAGQLKAIQDAIGAWHDWHTMQALALDLGNQRDLTTIILFLGNTEKQKYAEAIQSIDEMNTKLGLVPEIEKTQKKPQVATTRLNAATRLA